MTKANELVRDFPKKELSPECKNLVIGSSIIEKLEIDNPIPIDFSIHAYLGSTTNEKIKILNKYDQNRIQTLVIRDGTSNKRKLNSKPANENLLEHKKLTNSCIEKFNPDVFVVCKIPPLKTLSSIGLKTKKLMKSIILLHRTIPLNHPSKNLFFMLILKM